MDERIERSRDGRSAGVAGVARWQTKQKTCEPIPFVRPRHEWIGLRPLLVEPEVSARVAIGERERADPAEIGAELERVTADELRDAAIHCP